MFRTLLITSLFAHCLFSASTHQTDENFIVLLGNTGAGKSFVANFLIQPGVKQLVSSHSPSSVTAEFLAKPSVFKGWQVADTPGLDDNFRPLALIANEIKRALKASSGKYKLCFVISQTGGRVRTHDIITIKQILSAISGELPYYVLANLNGAEGITYEENFKSVVDNLIQMDSGMPGLRLPEAYLFLPKTDKNNKQDSITKFRGFVSRMKAEKITHVSDILKMSDGVKKVLDELLENPERYQKLLQPIRNGEEVTPYSYWPSPKNLMFLSCGAVLAFYYFNH